MVQVYSFEAIMMTFQMIVKEFEGEILDEAKELLEKTGKMVLEYF